MRISVFLSYPKPHLKRQQEFIEKLEKYLITRGFEPRTLGVTDYDMDAPLKAIRRLMLESNGLITIAFRRTLILNGKSRPDTELPGTSESTVQNIWFTSPYCQIEPAMAYQLGLPIIILREQGVIQEGLLEKGVVGTYMPEFLLEDQNFDYLQSNQWNDIIGKWEGFVRAVVDTKGNPPKLY
ncbi:TIR domain-containing protein [Candidatus Magnetomoraceae bacterium gMMP-15]